MLRSQIIEMSHLKIGCCNLGTTLFFLTHCFVPKNSIIVTLSCDYKKKQTKKKHNNANTCQQLRFTRGTPERSTK